MEELRYLLHHMEVEQLASRRPTGREGGPPHLSAHSGAVLEQKWNSPDIQAVI